MTKRLLVLLLIQLAWVGFACGDDDSGDSGDSSDIDSDSDTDTDTDSDTDNDTDTDTGPEPDQIVATLVLPDEFSEEIVSLSGFYYSIYPATGMPAGIVFNEASPDFGPGNPYEMRVDQIPDESGEYYFVAMLYLTGGGNGGCPVNAVDWIGQPKEMFTFGPGTGTIDLGTIELQRFF